ncbi:MAG: hypothetical protein E3K37_18525 [Candidatus Kuenenia sp.]|nr:hypothetical protein [Candidatus Kuenenia hertensis]
MKKTPVRKRREVEIKDIIGNAVIGVGKICVVVAISAIVGLILGFVSSVAKETKKKNRY